MIRGLERSRGGRPVGRRGVTLVEVVVALGILAIVLTLSMRAFWTARARMDEAEIGLRATLLLRELGDGAEPVARPLLGAVGRGSLVGGRGEDGRVRVRWESDGDDVSSPPRSWTLEPAP